jgi:hypothetical protein
MGLPTLSFEFVITRLLVKIKHTKKTTHVAMRLSLCTKYRHHARFNTQHK